MAYLNTAVKGTKHLFKGRTYTCIGFEPYTTKDGRDIELAVFEGNCAVCGSPFQVTTTVNGFERTNAFFTKHCQQHKRTKK